MADGVENAAVVCCFMTPKYQSSRNCEKELLYAERRRVSIIPCRLTRGWEPSTWLGLVNAGLVWMDFRDSTEANLDLKIDKLIDQIRVVAGTKLNCFLPGCSSDLPNIQNILYPTLPIANDLVRSTSMDSSPIPPPVPPRPNKELLRERLLNVEVKRTSNEQESLDDKRENR